MTNFNWLTGLLLSFLFSGMSSNGFGRSPLPDFLLPAPGALQSTNFSCGAAALISVLAYYGVEAPSESELIGILGTNENFGTKIEEMAKYANRFGIATEIKTNTTTQKIAESLKHRQLVLVEAQAWPAGGVPKLPYSETWDEGHYLVVIGMDSSNIYFRDPSLLGSIGFLSLPQFEIRWHDLSSKNEKLTHTAIFFQGKPDPPPALVPIP